MSEIALVSARKARLELEAKRGNKSAKTALKLANEPDRFLSTIQIGITLIGILTGLYSGEAFAYDLAEHVLRIPFLEPSALGVSKTTIVVIVTYLTLIMGELVPKRIGMGYAERVSMLVAKPMNFLSLVASPFVWLLSKSTALTVRLIGTDATEENKVTEEEIKAIVKEGFDVGEVQEVEQDIVERVFNLGDRNVGSIMSVYNALEQFKQARVKYGIVTDEFGGIQGIVTLKDIMEGLIGQVPDVGEEAEIVERSDGTWLVDGQYNFYDFLEYFDMEDLYAEHDYNTLSGLILEILERVPKTGEKLSWLNFEFEIVDMDGARIDKVLVSKIPQKE